MRDRNVCSSVGLLILLIVTMISATTAGPASELQNRDAQQSSDKPAAKPNEAFDPHNLDGVWGGDARGNGRWDNQSPEPPLTVWAKEHLLYKEGISHDPLAGTLIAPNRQPNPMAPGPDHMYFKTDLYGVPANVPDGEYPGKDCEPLSSPAVYEYPGLGSMELITTGKGDRIFQFFEYHREWRTFWLNKEHDKDLEPTYEGDSVARWEGNTLVVDTIGYNGKTMISGVVGHRKSDAFRLVEHIQLLDRDHLQIDLTYYDAKAWGDKSWTGFHKYYHRLSTGDFQEFICSPREYETYKTRVTDTLDTGKKK